MGLNVRCYRDESDLAAIDRILIEGRQANNRVYYVHPGDVRWWLYFLLPEDESWSHLFLWEAENEIVGWSLISLKAQAYDVFLAPDWVGRPEMAGVFAWTIRQAELVLGQRATGLYKYWNLVGDHCTLSLLEDLGFAPVDEDALLILDLASWENGQTTTGTNFLQLDHPPTGSTAKTRAGLPPGYQVRSCLGEAEVEHRAQAQHEAFESETDFPTYVERMRRFMSSPAYSGERDIVIGTPDRRIGAFCIYWLDSINRVGLIEPMGTHPSFQRIGLGRAVLKEALQRMKAAGMVKVQVCTSMENLAALALYQSVGFELSNRLVTVYRK